MIDESKVRRLKIMTFGLVGAIVLLVIFGIGQMTARPSKEESSEVKTPKQAHKPKRLTHAKVKSFLVAYYTKKDLGTNRNRYKPFMTEALYQEEISKEEEAVYQAYKGYVVDFTFDEADIYINPTTNVAIAQVTYTNTILEKKGDYETAQKNVNHQVTLKLTYVEEKENLKLNNLQTAVLQLDTEELSELPDYGTLTASHSEPTEGE
ncbi:PrgL [Streptococcus agalactiae LMG 14747]|uniref:PrgL n=1 Tax=Streptococcus agalactiae LMG 14747 TaxID=1154860 RepID=V6Z1W6_STRAG|nr:PrgL [Streptococcus agalactiae LMG 14747]